MDPDMAQSGSTDVDISVALGRSVGHPHQYDPQQKQGLWVCLRLQVAAQTSEICGNVGQRNQRGPASLFILLPKKFRPLGWGTCSVLLVNPEYYPTSQNLQLESHHQSSFCHQQKRASHKCQGIDTFWGRETFILITWVLTTIFCLALWSKVIGNHFLQLQKICALRR